MRAFFSAALLLQAQESHTAAHYMLDRPMQGSVWIARCRKWPTRGFCIRGGPTQAYQQYRCMYTTGQCELIAQILLHRKWAHVRILQKGFQAAVGQLELICDIYTFTPWANASIFHGSTPAAGLHESLIRQPHFLLDGPQILLHRKWAHARILHRGFQAAVSQLELISDIHALHHGPMQAFY